MQSIRDYLPSSTPVVPPSPSSIHPIVIAKADSGASRHYIRDDDKSILNFRKKDLGPTVLLPNNDSMTSTESGILPLSGHLNAAAKKAHIFSDLHSASLISLGQLCDDNCTIVLGP